MSRTIDKKKFPPFSLTRLLGVVFAPRPDEKVAILIDLPDPLQMKDFAFLHHAELPIQRLAHDVFYEGLKTGGLAELKLRGGEMFAYQLTGGSNLDLPPVAYDAVGRKLKLEQDLFPHANILLCISTFSATAPLTAFAKKYGFRGATMHGLNDIILRSGLAVDYNDVSRQAEQFRLGLTRAEAFEIHYQVLGQKHALRVKTGGQEAQKSHGLCRGEHPDIVNLPAGEVYFVPQDADGVFPMRYEDGTLGLMQVGDGRIQKAIFLSGQGQVVDKHNERLKSDPATGMIGELGFGTQELPPAGRDIQDEKILGTLHLATGRNDHLGGPLTPDKFADPRNATHDDILFAPKKNPEIKLSRVVMIRDGQKTVLIERYKPCTYLKQLLTGQPSAVHAETHNDLSQQARI